jgi:hypothetical protein
MQALQAAAADFLVQAAPQPAAVDGSAAPVVPQRGQHALSGLPASTPQAALPQPARQARKAPAAAAAPATSRLVTTSHGGAGIAGSERRERGDVGPAAAAAAGGFKGSSGGIDLDSTAGWGAMEAQLVQSLGRLDEVLQPKLAGVRRTTAAEAAAAVAAPGSGGVGVAAADAAPVGSARSQGVPRSARNSTGPSAAVGASAAPASTQPSARPQLPATGAASGGSSGLAAGGRRRRASQVARVGRQAAASASIAAALGSPDVSSEEDEAGAAGVNGAGRDGDYDFEEAQRVQQQPLHDAMRIARPLLLPVGVGLPIPYPTVAGAAAAAGGAAASHTASASGAASGQLWSWQQRRQGGSARSAGESKVGVGDGGEAEDEERAEACDYDGVDSHADGNEAASDDVDSGLHGAYAFRSRTGAMVIAAAGSGSGSGVALQRGRAGVPPQLPRPASFNGFALGQGPAAAAALRGDGDGSGVAGFHAPLPQRSQQHSLPASSGSAASASSHSLADVIARTRALASQAAAVMRTHSAGASGRQPNSQHAEGPHEGGSTHISHRGSSGRQEGDADEEAQALAGDDVGAFPHSRGGQHGRGNAAAPLHPHSAAGPRSHAFRSGIAMAAPPGSARVVTAEGAPGFASADHGAEGTADYSEGGIEGDDDNDGAYGPSHDVRRHWHAAPPTARAPEPGHTQTGASAGFLAGIEPGRAAVGAAIPAGRQPRMSLALLRAAAEGSVAQ